MRIPIPVGDECKFRDCTPPDKEGCRPIQCRVCGRWIKKFCGSSATANCPAPMIVRRPWQCGQLWSYADAVDDIIWQFNRLEGFGDLTAWFISCFGIVLDENIDCSKCNKRRKWMNTWKPLVWLWNTPKALWFIFAVTPHLLLNWVVSIPSKVWLKIFPNR